MSVYALEVTLLNKKYCKRNEYTFRRNSLMILSYTVCGEDEQY